MPTFLLLPAPSPTKGCSIYCRRISTALAKKSIFCRKEQSRTFRRSLIYCQHRSQGKASAQLGIQPACPSVESFVRLHERSSLVRSYRRSGANRRCKRENCLSSPSRKTRRLCHDAHRRGSRRRSPKRDCGPECRRRNPGFKTSLATGHSSKNPLVCSGGRNERLTWLRLERSPLST